MTQKEFAKSVGVSRQTINAIEVSKYPPTLEAAFRTADVFATSLENVFFYQPEDELIVEITWNEDDDNDGKMLKV